jgi:hypothetical protein
VRERVAEHQDKQHDNDQLVEREDGYELRFWGRFTVARASAMEKPDQIVDELRRVDPRWQVHTNGR